jgi:hypothetical protein
VRVRAGDRAPDVAFETEGKRITLFELLTGGEPVALISGSRVTPILERLDRLGISGFGIAPAADCPSRRQLRDLHGDFLRFYGATGEFVYLIRPDGYIGLFQRPPNLRQLADYLMKIRAPDAVEKIFSNLDWL